MKSLEVVWSATALADLDEILAYIRGQDPVTADRVAARINERVGTLSIHPRLGRAGRVRGTRELVVAPFIIAYELAGDLVVVLAVLRGRRRWPRSFVRGAGSVRWLP
ncbi:type II toxin-antitoxin system RelE/ParE family toxin [Reyranella sp.]|uniref:type II toxin-antitoxin system RelE/ParE family toxin n=1 Tax=Reyranella sp. TaxID=1929291 RepID=UPI0037842E21